MNLYKIDGTLLAERHLTVQKWAGTQADAKQAAKDMQVEFPNCQKPVITPVEFPTDKTGLLAWLNDNKNFHRNCF